jgi:hypothetical protein
MSYPSLEILTEVQEQYTCDTSPRPFTSPDLLQRYYKVAQLIASNEFIPAHFWRTNDV